MEDKHTHDPRRKASLRGKGREIFLGPQASDENADATPAPAEDAPDLTADETSALLELLSDAPTAPPPSADALPYPDELPPSSGFERQEAVPLGERGPTRPAAEDSAPAQPASPDVQALEPEMPETWTEEKAPPEPTPITPIGDEGGLAPTANGQLAWEDPFAHRGKRPEAHKLFPETDPADPALLYMLVDDERIRQLDTLIEKLLEDLSDCCRAPTEAVEAYRKDLLYANGLLMASRENYDDARAIVYRVRGEIARQRQTEADIARYRPLLLNYYLGWFVTLAVLFLLKALFVGVAEAVGVNALSALYYPALSGIGGALISGLLTLERHTSVLRDFDPMHVSWYLLNPLLGGVMGVLMFLLVSVANDDLLRETANPSETAIAYLLCVVAGMNQSVVLHRLDELRRRVGNATGAGKADEDTPPQST